MAVFNPRLPEIGSPARAVFQGLIDREERRTTILTSTRRKVYERANKRCECCGKPMRISQGQFHHLRKPSIRATEKTVQFLCASDHNEHGHKYLTARTNVKNSLIPAAEKKTTIKRLRVRKHPSSPYWREFRKPGKMRKSKK